MENWLKLSESESWIKKEFEKMNNEEKHDAFYKSLEFGTAGMRGLLGIGPNRMNIYTVAKASMGYGKYLSKNFSGPLKVAIAYDNRHQSQEFANISALILSKYKIDSYVFSLPRPTPELSFAIRELGCVGGIVITASHNPKEYNGYKVYDETGCQLVDHKIKEVIQYVNEIEDETSIDLYENTSTSMIRHLDEDFDELYIEKLKMVPLRNELEKNIKIVFSSQHGTSYPLVPNILKDLGYEVIVVEEQANYDPDFTNTKTPNPEDKAAYELPLEYAKKHDADLILVVDPDADRMGISVKHKGEYINITGNEGGSILQEYLYSTLVEKDIMPENPLMINTIVTSDLGEVIAQSYDVEVMKTLTGFKYIGEKIEKHKKSDFLFGYEESYGYLIKPFVRDKDALQACLLVADAANYYYLNNKSLIDVLYELYDRHGAYYDKLESLTLEGQEGLERIQNILKHFRESSVEAISNIKVLRREDYLGEERPSGFPESNVLKFILEDGSWIAIRPSGTEPKCKFYYCVKDESLDLAKEKYKLLSEYMNKIIEEV